MTTPNFERLLQTPEYDFLRTDPHLGGNVCLLGLGGSYAYGTNVEGSDVDVRGIFLNSKREILLNNPCEQVVDNSTDTTVYGLNKMIGLLAACNPNTVEILGLKPEHYLIKTDVGQMMLDNRHVFLSKRAVGTFGGYANQQLYRLQQLSSHSMEQKELEKHILTTIRFLSEDFAARYHLDPKNTLEPFIDVSEQPDMETEIFMNVHLDHYPLRDYCDMWSELKQIVSSYKRLGKRNTHAVEHEKVSKHAMHLVRLYHMAFDILLRGEIKTFRTDDHELLMDIRNGKYTNDDNSMKPEFFEMVGCLEADLASAKEKSELPDKPDMDAVNRLLYSINERVVCADIRI